MQQMNGPAQFDQPSYDQPSYNQTSQQQSSQTQSSYYAKQYNAAQDVDSMLQPAVKVGNCLGVLAIVMVIGLMSYLWSYFG